MRGEGWGEGGVRGEGGGGWVGVNVITTQISDKDKEGEV